MEEVPDPVRNALWETARDHFELEPKLNKIVVVSRNLNREFLFFEINEDALSTGRVDVFSFAPDGSFPWPLYIADLTAEEWNKVQNGDIAWPKDWPTTPLLVFSRSDLDQQPA